MHSVPNILRVLGSFAAPGLQACASECSVATFGSPKVSSFIHRRSSSSSLCFRVTIHHLRPPEGELLHSSQVLGGANYPSGTLAPQYQGPADRLGDVFESGINLRARSRRSSPQQGPSGRANGCDTHNAYKERYQGPYVSLPEKDKDERWPGGASRPPGSAEPGRPPVQVHFEESAPSLLITFHTCIWWEPTSTSINRAPSHPSHTHTHTSFRSLQEGSPLSCSLS